MESQYLLVLLLTDTLIGMESQYLLVLLLTDTLIGSTTDTSKSSGCLNMSKQMLDNMPTKETIQRQSVLVNHGENLILNCTCLNECNGQWSGPNTILLPNAGDFIPYTQGMDLNPRLDKSRYSVFGGYDSLTCNLHIRNFLSDDDGTYMCQYVQFSTVYIDVYNVSATRTEYFAEISTEKRFEKSTPEIINKTKRMDYVNFPKQKFLTLEWVTPLIVIIIAIPVVAAGLLWRRKAKREQNSSSWIEDIAEDAPGNLVENDLYQSSHFLELMNVREQDAAILSSEMHAAEGDISLNVRQTQQESEHNVKGILFKDAHAQIREINKNYAEVMFEIKPSTHHFVIHGDDERTIYSEIDHSIRAEPLPSSSSESEEE